MKEVQDFLRTEIQANPQLANYLVPNMIADVRAVDLEADAHIIHTEANCLLLWARLCQGKNPASKVFAERFVSLEWLIYRFLEVPAAWDHVDVGHRYKRALLTSLNEIYLTDADFIGIQHHVKVIECGFWTLDGEAYSNLEHCRPLMLMAHDELACLARALAALVSSALPGVDVAPQVSDSSDQKAKVFLKRDAPPLGQTKILRVLTAEYVFYMRSMLRLVRDYYWLPALEMPQRCRNYRVTQQLRSNMEVLAAVLQNAVVAKSEPARAHTCGGDLDLLIDSVREAQNALAQPTLPDKGSRKNSGYSSYSKVAEKGASKSRASKNHCGDLSHRVTHTLIEGFRAIAAAVSDHLMAGQTCSALPLLLSRDTRAPLYDNESSRNPTYASLLAHTIPMLKSSATADDTLFEVLGLMRGCIYLNDPYNPFRSPDSYAASWRAYLDLTAIPCHDSNDGDLLSWVQNKYNTIGCTEVGIRLVGHRRSLVQVQAICLLLALLQQGNRKVQETMTLALNSPKYSSFFVSISHVLIGTIKSLKEYKRKARPQNTGKLPVTWQQDNRPRDIIGSTLGPMTEDDVEGIGRRSHVMLTLRLVQLMCSKQVHIVVRYCVMK